MEKIRNVNHKFNLHGLAVGDSFLGCSGCWFRFDPQTAAVPTCPECGKKMHLYDVTKDDIKNLKGA